MFVLTGSFLIVEGLSAALFHRNMQRLSELVNKGELDFVLTRPISSQFLVSIRYVDFGDLPTAVVGVVYLVHRDRPARADARARWRSAATCCWSAAPCSRSTRSGSWR